MARVVGIDLGTTNSVVAYMENGHPVIIPNAEGGRLTPSLVAFLEDGNRLVGQLAKRIENRGLRIEDRDEKAVSILDPRSSILESFLDDLGDDRVIASIKRQMGSDARVWIDDREYTPEEISAMILRKVKTDAERYLGEEIGKAVITVPAYFNDGQRKATKDAGTIAGLEVIRIVNEPTAAALAYGLDKENVHTILVWDLGGGTFDVSILELGDGIFEVKAVNGDTHLGGDDYDQRIVEYLADEFQTEWGIDLRQDPMARQRLKEAAELAKIELSSRLTTTIRLPSLVTGRNGSEGWERTLTRATFDALTEDLRQRMVGPTLQALGDANLVPEDIDRVILVGGATRMPAVQDLIQTLIGRVPYKYINPDEVVALGAAIQAGILTGEVREIILVDVNPLSLGIETQGGIFARIIHRNTPIPTSQSQIFTTACDHQPAVDIHVLQGEREMAMYNMTLGRFRLSDIEPQPRGEPRIEVIFDIDANSLVHVSAVDLQTGNTQRIEITSMGGLSPEEVERMVQEARLHIEEDQRQREEVEIGIRAESMIAAADHMMRQVEEAHEVEAREATVTSVTSARWVTPLVDEVHTGVLALEAALAAGESQEIRSRMKSVETLIKKLDATMKRMKQPAIPSP